MHRENVSPPFKNQEAFSLPVRQLQAYLREQMAKEIQGPPGVQRCCFVLSMLVCNYLFIFTVWGNLSALLSPWWSQPAAGWFGSGLSPGSSCSQHKARQEAQVKRDRCWWLLLHEAKKIRVKLVQQIDISPLLNGGRECPQLLRSPAPKTNRASALQRGQLWKPKRTQVLLTEEPPVPSPAFTVNVACMKFHNGRQLFHKKCAVRGYSQNPWSCSHISKLLTWHSTEVEVLFDGRREDLVGAHCVISLCVHIYLDHTAALDNLERKHRCAEKQHPSYKSEFISAVLSKILPFGGQEVFPMAQGHWLGFRVMEGWNLGQPESSQAYLCTLNHTLALLSIHLSPKQEGSWAGKSSEKKHVTPLPSWQFSISRAALEYWINGSHTGRLLHRAKMTNKKL